MDIQNPPLEPKPRRKHEWEKLEDKPYSIYYSYSRNCNVYVFKCKCRLCGKIDKRKFIIKEILNNATEIK